MRCAFVALGLAAGLSGAAGAFDFEPVKPLDVRAIDPGMVADIYGAYEIRDKSGKKRCHVTLLKEPSIGGSQIDIASGCDKVFPIMADITAWRLLEGWTIDLVDSLRKTRVRFATPDDRYIPFGDANDIASMDELLKLKAKPAARKK